MKKIFLAISSFFASDSEKKTENKGSGIVTTNDDVEKKQNDYDAYDYQHWYLTRYWC